MHSNTTLVKVKSYAKKLDEVKKEKFKYNTC